MPDFALLPLARRLRQALRRCHAPYAAQHACAPRLSATKDMICALRCAACSSDDYPAQRYARAACAAHACRPYYSGGARADVNIRHATGIRHFRCHATCAATLLTIAY